MDYGEARRPRRQEIMITRAIVVTVLSLTACAAAAADLGRMLFTPEQRATLDKSRKQNNRTETDGDFKPPAPPVPQNVSVGGLIRRSDGKYTIWLNNQVVNERQTGAVNAGMGRRENHVRLKAHDGERSVEVKVGQTLEMVSGTIEDNYARRTVAKSVANTTAGGENSASDMPKVMPSQPREPVKLETFTQKRPARAVDSDGAEDLKSNRRMEAK